jgi:uncharacterized protein (TIGR02118 family)
MRGVARREAMSETDAFPTLFVLFDDPDAEVGEAEIALIAEALDGVHGLRQAFAFTPMPPGDQPFARDGRGPALTLQFDFETSKAADAALTGDGALAGIPRPGAIPALAKARVAHQRMTGRNFAVPDGAFRWPPGGKPCTFLVNYGGTAGDLDAWLDHYDAHHPAIMARFPGIRAVATYRPAPTATDGLPGARANSMQRNKVVFDSPAALEAALASPVMAEMRADTAGFPDFSERPMHFVTATWRLK